MKRVSFHPEAELELAESVVFYESRVAGLGGDFFAAVKLACRRIQRHPLLHALRPDGTRKVRLRRFPHAIIYRDKPEATEIIAVAHGARRPYYWRSRL